MRGGCGSVMEVREGGGSMVAGAGGRGRRSLHRELLGCGFVSEARRDVGDMMAAQAASGAGAVGADWESQSGPSTASVQG